MVTETTLRIPAIHCDSCVSSIGRTLKALPTVNVVQADAETKRVRVSFDESAVNVDRIREALDGVGFSADD